jgi:hypothetical protein
MVTAQTFAAIMRAIIGIGGLGSLQKIRTIRHSLWTYFDSAYVGAESTGRIAGRAYGAVVVGHRRLMISRLETKKSTWATV